MVNLNDWFIHKYLEDVSKEALGGSEVESANDTKDYRRKQREKEGLGICDRTLY